MSNLPKKIITDRQGNEVLPITHVSAVYDDSGTPVSTLIANAAEEASKSYVPTLDAAPGSSTTTYTRDGATKDFVLGQFCRAAGSDGYDFYQLIDLTLENSTPVATWQKSANDYPVMGASGSGHSSGLVPDTPESPGTTKYLREDGTWSEPCSVMGASGSGHSSGLVPDTPGTAGTSKYLREDGTWSEPEGGYVPTLDAAPGSATVTYVKDGQTKNFVLGQLARVANASAGSGYDFYQLYDLQSNGTVASWQILTVGSMSAASGGTGLSLVTTGEKYIWNNKQDTLSVMGASGSGHSSGLVPDTPSTAGTTKYLCENGTWVRPTLDTVGASSSVVAITAATSSSCSITGSSNSGKMQTIVYTNNSGSSKVVTVPTTYKTPDGAAIELEVPNGGYCEVNYLNIGGTIYARGL